MKFASISFIISICLMSLGLFGFGVPNNSPNYHALFATPYSIAEIIIGVVGIGSFAHVITLKEENQTLTEKVNDLKERLKYRE